MAVPAQKDRVFNVMTTHPNRLIYGDVEKMVTCSLNLPRVNRYQSSAHTVCDIIASSQGRVLQFMFEVVRRGQTHATRFSEWMV
jgi:hypothetical protein